MTAHLLAAIFGARLVTLLFLVFIAGLLPAAAKADEQMANFKPIEFEGINSKKYREMKTKIERKIHD